jgi:hypothetical protein
LVMCFVRWHRALNSACTAARTRDLTFEVCDLNRPLLERGRVRSRRVVEYCLQMWAAARLADNASVMREAVTTVREQPFADVCQSMLRQAEAPGAEIIFGDSPKVLSLLRSPEVRGALLS